MAKKKNKRIETDGFVFSTNTDFEFQDEFSENDTLPNNQQKLIAKLEKKGRGGKTVTIVEGYVGTEEDLKDLAKILKNKCGTGGSVKDGEIVIQGDVRVKVVEVLQKDGYKVKKSGG
ncbi:MAG: translation initiation factor [Ichthyobacteriaceae bacterium]|nr:translation initiation factor [Ichthyobacteriaceae bacterium]